MQKGNLRLGTIFGSMALAALLATAAGAAENKIAQLTASRGLSRVAFDVPAPASKFQASASGLQAGASEFRIEVRNGESKGKNRVSSAVVTLNGVALLRQSDFNQNVTLISRKIDERLFVGKNNLLEIEINGNPAGYLDAAILATYPDPQPIPTMVAWYRDMDRDGYGTGSPTYLPLGAPPPADTPVYQWVELGGDCNDTRADIYPVDGFCPPRP